MAAKLARMENTPDNLVFYSEDLAVHPQSGKVVIRGQQVRLGLINMQVLLVLLEFDGKVVSRADFLDRVWKNQVVSDDVLTRCISELRTILGEHSTCPALIETLPKRGYRWVPEICNQKVDQFMVPVTQSKQPQSRWKRISIAVSGGLILLVLFAMSVLWAIELSLKTELVKVALIPVHVSQPDLLPIAADLDDILKVQLLKTKNLRFISRSAINNKPQQVFFQLSKELHAKWIIEGNIREKNHQYHVSLSLVDARTALVVFSLSRDIKNKPAQLEMVCTLFLNEVSQFLP